MSHKGDRAERAQEKRRARSSEDKARRVEVILEAARAMLSSRRIDEVTVATIASAARLGKASLYTYFEGKEDILLTLFEAELRGLSEAIQGAIRGDLRPEEAARALVEGIDARLVYRKLAVVLHTQLEPRVSRARRVRFQRLMLSELERGGLALERALPTLPEGGGVSALFRLHALALGFHQLLGSDGLIVGTRRAFTAEMEGAFAAVLQGMTRSGADGQSGASGGLDA